MNQNFIKGIDVKASFLTDFVITSVAISAILLLGNYILLSAISRDIPAEMTTLISSLALGTFGAAAARDEKTLNLTRSYNFVDFSLMGFAATGVVLSLHYNLLLWGDGAVRKDVAPMIGGLATIVLGITNFRGTTSNH